MRIALTGNPNSGKTSLFNVLTGSTESVGNWSGVTVSDKSAPMKKEYVTRSAQVEIVDLPGAYSISPYSADEAITRDYVMDRSPDAIINIIDGANVERSLLFATQLLDLGIPVVVALNKSDILKKRGDSVDTKLLSDRLGCPVFPIVATTAEGIIELMAAVISSVKDKRVQMPCMPEVKGDIDHDADILRRQQFASNTVNACMRKRSDASQVRFSDKLDMILANRWLGLPIFFLVMWAVYAFSIEGLGGYLSGYSNDILFGEIVPTTANTWLEGLGVSPLLQAFIVDGIIGGVGAVIGFLPLIMVLFFCLSLLEDSGYMARVAVVMDRYFKKIGLSGKSIIPMIVGSGCSIPGVMATRTIEDINERRATTMLTPFVPCGAKLPIIALFSMVFFPDATWVGPSMYLLAIAMIIIGGLILKHVFVWESSAPFIIELPEYKIPSLRLAFNSMIKQANSFIYKASTIILTMNTLVWFLQTYNFSLQVVEDPGTSILAFVGGIIAPLLIPLGFVGWQLAAAAVTGFIAKENVVATFAIILAVASEEALMMPGGAMTTLFTPVTAYAYLVFNLFTPPCFAAMGAMNAELGSRKWLYRAIAFQFSVGYILAMVITQVGSLMIYGTPAVGFQYAIVIAIAFIAFLTYRFKKVAKLEVSSDKA